MILPSPQITIGLLFISIGKNIEFFNMFPPDMDINKGVELILKGDKKKPPKQTPKFFDINLALFGREIRLSIDIKKKN